MKRNYLIDVIKFVFTILVVISHTYSFIGENTTIITVKLCSSLGWWSVHFFFIVSGMLMVNSAMKHNQKLSSGGEEAWRFVIKKFLSIAAEYWTALFIALVVFVIFNRNISLIEVVTRIIPEMFVMNQAGFKSLEINTASWYISAMLICMLPLYYLLITKKDLYIYVFAPLVALISYGYMYNQESMMPGQYKFTGVVYMGIIMALNGLCFGSVSWLISDKAKTIQKKTYKVLLTVVEVGVYLYIFYIWFRFYDNNSVIYAVMFLLPISLGISFSGVTYSGELFKSEKLKRLSKISLAIYLNQIAARNIVRDYFGGLSYKLSCVTMIMFLILLCVLYYIILLGVSYYREKILSKIR